MSNSLIAPYTQALSAQKAQLDSYVDSGFNAIVLPGHISQIESRGLHMLGKSAVWFLIIGVIAFVAGLFIKNMGVIIAGCAAITSGGYLWVKGKQANRADAYNSLSDKIYSEIQALVNKVSSDWNSFIGQQNDSLVKDIVSSTAATADAKVSDIDRLEQRPAVNIDLAAIKSQLNAVSGKEDLKAYSVAIASARTSVQTAVANADGARQASLSQLTCN